MNHSLHVLTGFPRLKLRVLKRFAKTQDTTDTILFTIQLEMMKL